MSILSRILQKRGIKSFNELENEEKKTFESWEKILSKNTEVTLQDIRKFCQTQCSIIEGKWKDYEMPQSKKAEMLPYFVVYRTLSSIIDSPDVEKEQLEKYLNQLLN